jgi:hypothetical protein
MNTYPRSPQRLARAFLLAVLLFAPAAWAQVVLIDFGNNNSYRSTNVVNPGVSNAYWNSLDPGQPGVPQSYANLINTNNLATTIDIAFSNVAPQSGWGMCDSYNGPAGTSLDFNTSDVDGNVLGVMGQKAAVFDFYVNGKFTLSDLPVNTYYSFTFFGSHKYNNNNTTTYRVHTNNWGVNAYVWAWTNALIVGDNANHNRDKVATIANVVPQANNTVMIACRDAAGGNYGYLNCMKIEDFPGPAIVITNGGVTVSVNSYDLKGTNACGVIGTMTFSNTTTGVQYTQAAPGSPFGWSQTFSSLANGVNNILVTGTNALNMRITSSTTITYTLPPALASNVVAVTAPGASVTNLISQAVTVTTESWSNHAAQIGYGPDNTGANWLWFPVSTSVGGIGYTGSKSFALPIGLHYIAARWINGGITNYGWDSAGQANAGTLAATLWVVVTNTPEMVRPTPWDLSVNDLDGITWGAGMSGNCSGGILGLDGFSHSATADTYSNVTFAMSTDGYQAPGFYCTVRRDSTGPRKIDLDYYDGSSWTYAAMTFELAAAGTWYTIGSSFNGSGAVGTQFRLVGYSATGSQLDLKDVQVTSPVPEPALAVLACLALLGLRRRCA